MGLEHMRYKARLKEMVFFSPEKTSRSCCCVQLPRDDGARLFLEVYSDITRGTNKLEREKF